MECGTPVQLFNFLIATSGTVIIDIRPGSSYRHCKLRYPMLIHLPILGIREGKSHTPLCEHHIATGPPLSQEELTQAINELEQMVGPYERCVLRQRLRATLVLVTETDEVGDKVAALASLFLQEGKVSKVFHTAFSFEQFSIFYPFTVELDNTRRISNCSVAMPKSISLEMDDFQILKQKKSLITQYPNSIISRNLFLGNRQQALNLEMMIQMNITHIIRAHDIRENEYIERPGQSRAMMYKRVDHIKYLDIAVDDKLGTSIALFFKPCISFYNDALASNRSASVLVHCNMGISRSSAVVIALLIANEGMTLRQALEFCQKSRHQVQPNYSFMKELIKFEHEIRGANSLKVVDLAKLNEHYNRAHAVDTKGDIKCDIM